MERFKLILTLILTLIHIDSTTILSNLPTWLHPQFQKASLKNSKTSL